MKITDLINRVDLIVQSARQEDARGDFMFTEKEIGQMILVLLEEVGEK